jgi:gamma-glutamylcyclotransferase
LDDNFDAPFCAFFMPLRGFCYINFSPNLLSLRISDFQSDPMKLDFPGEIVWGVLFNIDSKEKRLLDKAEGLGIGYNEDRLTFIDENNNTHAAQVYIGDSKSLNNDLLPYDWYKEFIVTGAMQNNLPRHYISQLQSISCTTDPDETRRVKNYAILSGT